MIRFVVVAAIVIVTGVLLALTTDVEPTRSVSVTRVLDVPVVSTSENSFGWLTVSSGGTGVLVIGLGGLGVVCFSLAGAGLLFATGQVSAGMIAFGQAGLGLVFFLGQAGTGLAGAGQVVVGLLGWGQGRLALDGEEFLRDLNRDMNDLLRFR